MRLEHDHNNFLRKKIKEKSWNLVDFTTFGGDKRDRTADLLNAIGVLFCRII